MIGSVWILTNILRHSGEIIKVGTAVGATVPFTGIVKRMLGPAADEIAERVRDEIRIYRYGRQLSLLQKAERMATEAEFTPKAVPTKLLFALLEGASLEENEDLHDKWAALLANAANPAMAASVRPSFADTLKLMTPEVAHFLDAVYARANEPTTTVLPASDLGIDYDEEVVPRAFYPSLELRKLRMVDLGTYKHLFAMFERTAGTSAAAEVSMAGVSQAEQIEQDEADRQNFAIVMDELTRFQIWSVRIGKNSADHFYLSSYAVQFLTACHRPELAE